MIHGVLKISLWWSLVGFVLLQLSDQPTRQIPGIVAKFCCPFWLQLMFMLLGLCRLSVGQTIVVPMEQRVGCPFALSGWTCAGLGCEYDCEYAIERVFSGDFDLIRCFFSLSKALNRCVWQFNRKSISFKCWSICYNVVCPSTRLILPPPNPSGNVRH